MGLLNPILFKFPNPIYTKFGHWRAQGMKGISKGAKYLNALNTYLISCTDSFVISIIYSNCVYIFSSFVILIFCRAGNKTELLQPNRNQFPSLRIFVIKNVGKQKKTKSTFIMSVLKVK